MTNRELFKTLYAKYFRRMVRFYQGSPFRLSEEEAKDLAQDSFLRFYEAVEDYRGDAEWAFLETIARRVGFNSIRARKTMKRGGGSDLSLDDVPPSQQPAAPERPDYADIEAGKVFRRQVREAMAELSPGQRQCMQLRAEGFRYKQIASILKISIDAVKSRLRDAKKQLQERLGEEGVNWPDRLPEDEQ
jgi:RNA polymerase sigma-70 factor (ECF subfamily)